MPDTRGETVRRQFGPSAEAYLASASHARGEDLDQLIGFAAVAATDVALDVGCGVGHTLRRLAPLARLVVGADLTVGMLQGAQRLVATEGIANAILVVSPAEALPFLDGSFNVVTCRLAAHHFFDVAAAFREARRALGVGGRFVLADNYAPDDHALDRFINTLERLRDPSHVREHTVGAWRELLRAAGLEPRDEARTMLRIDRERWLAQARTIERDADAVRAMLRSADTDAVRAFRIDEDGFSVLKVIISAEAR